MAATKRADCNRDGPPPFAAAHGRRHCHFCNPLLTNLRNIKNSSAIFVISARATEATMIATNVPSVGSKVQLHRKSAMKRKPKAKADGTMPKTLGAILL